MGRPLLDVFACQRTLCRERLPIFSRIIHPSGNILHIHPSTTDHCKFDLFYYNETIPTGGGWLNAY